MNPSGFGVRDNHLTKSSDIYAFGMAMYQVSNPCFILGKVTEGRAQVITGEQPFPQAHAGMILYKVVAGERPDRPPGPNEWLSDDIWNFISRCWSQSWSDRPEVGLAIDALNSAAEAVEAKRRKFYTATNDHGKKASRWVSAALRRYPMSKGQGRIETLPPDGRFSLASASLTSASTKTSTVWLEPWEVDLAAFLRTCAIETEAELGGKKAQEFADKLNVVRNPGKRIHLFP